MASEATAHGPAGEAAAEVIRLDRELSEIEGLIAQAREESKRHDQRRVLAEEHMASVLGEESVSATNLKSAIDGLVSSTRRAWLMESQIEVLEGKQRTLARFRDRLQHYVELLAARPDLEASEGVPIDGDDDGSAAAAPAQIVEAQETLRRDIAKAMHDGPAQSLTNLALQTQIVERVLVRDPARAAAEVGELLSMVRAALEETNTFILDIRPMVLDDLGLVATLRRTVRDRGRRAKVPIEFDSRGPDRRLGRDLETNVFRVLDDAIIGFLATRSTAISVRLKWAEEELRAEVRSARVEEVAVEPPPTSASSSPAEPPVPELSDDLPPALAAMIMERRAAASDVARA
ncbi:MAG: sensor histidine kinase, partial [Candidatus Limnocylindrales bacterium]